MSKPVDVDTLGRLKERVGADQDDVLATLQLVRGDTELEDRLFHQLVTLLVEGMFLDLREQHRCGQLDQDVYAAELGALAGQCRAQGLLTAFGDD